MKLLYRWLVTSLTIFAVPYLVSGVHVESFGAALAAAAILGILNILVKPVLILLTLPLTVFTLGFFLLVINALMFQLAGKLISGLAVANFGSAFLGALVVSLVSWIMHMSLGNRNGKRVVMVNQDDTIDLRRDNDGEWK
jgi:putative membrane protein